MKAGLINGAALGLGCEPPECFSLFEKARGVTRGRLAPPQFLGLYNPPLRVGFCDRSASVFSRAASIIGNTSSIFSATR